MGQYGKTAIRAVQLIQAEETKSPSEAWETAAAQVIKALTSRKKSCPRDAFLGLCEEGLVRGIPSAVYTDSIKNKAYAVEAARLLKTNPDMEQSTLWSTATHDSGIQHNGQIDVVLALHNNHLLS